MNSIKHINAIMTHKMFKMPKGLWTDFEETIIQQDRQFLTEVARGLSLPINEVLRRCLGTGSPQAILVGDVETDACPWWTRHGDGLWRPCNKYRLTVTTPCHLHTQSQSSHEQCLGSDPRLASIKTATPMNWNGEIYWTTDTDTYHEDGRLSSIKFKQIDHRGTPMYVAVKNE
jgi:hypothetical protein